MAEVISGCGVRGVRGVVAESVGNDGCCSHGPTPPSYSVFVGKPWEAEYPRLLGAYYDAFRAFGSGGVRCENELVVECDDAVSNFGAGLRGGTGAAVDGVVDFVSASPDGCSSGGSSDGVGSPCIGTGSGGSGDAGSSVGATGSVCGGRSGTDIDRVVAVVPIESVAGVVAGGLGRGPNYERNCRLREKRKNKKMKRQAMGCDWRIARRGDDQIKTSGFWNSCSGEVRQKLIDSKARMHIAENERKARENESKVLAMDSVSDEMKLAQELIRVTRMAQQLEKQTQDRKIGGWAATVADSLTRSVADKAPDSIPSLESVGLGSSASDLTQSLQVELDSVKVDMERLRVENEKLKAERDHLETVKRNVEFQYADYRRCSANVIPSLQSELRAELLEVENKYLKMNSFDPSMLEAEKRMVRNKMKYARLNSR